MPCLVHKVVEKLYSPPHTYSSRHHTNSEGPEKTPAQSCPKPPSRPSRNGRYNHNNKFFHKTPFGEYFVTIALTPRSRQALYVPFPFNRSKTADVPCINGAGRLSSANHRQPSHLLGSIRTGSPSTPWAQRKIVT